MGVSAYPQEVHSANGLEFPGRRTAINVAGSSFGARVLIIDMGNRERCS